MEIYHGSPKKFSKFDLQYIGSNKGTSGAGLGFYFTDNIKEAKTYGKYIYVIDLTDNINKLKKPLSNFKRTLNSVNIIKLIKSLYKQSNGDFAYWENYAYEYMPDDNEMKLNIVNDLLTLTDTEILANFWNSGADEKHICKWLIQNNFTHTLDQYDNNSFKNSQHYILYFEPKIKEIIEL